jgi:hypothetical protein
VDTLALAKDGRIGPWARAYGRLAVPLAAVLAALAALRFGVMLTEAARSPGSIGIDYTTVIDGTNRWLHGGSPFAPRQLAGPYLQIGANLSDSGEFLYPPIALPFFAPFTVLPGICWWATPAVLFGAGLLRLRPARWTWPLLAFLALAGQSIPLVIAWNPTIWIVTFAVWAPFVGWTGPLVLLKPTVAPLALLGIRHRSWWITAGLLAIACVPFGSLWRDWLTAVTNMRTNGPPGFAFSLLQLPFLLLPFVAWLGRRSPPKRDPVATGELPSPSGTR